MFPNRRIFLNIIDTYGQRLYALVLGVFIGQWVLMALGESDYDYIIESTNPMKINGRQVEVKLYKGGKTERISERRNREISGKEKHKTPFGKSRKREVYTDYIPDRKKRSKKRH